LPEDEDVERVAVVAVRPGDEAVVGGVVHRAEEHPVDLEEPRLLVELVFDARPLRDLDDGLKVLGQFARLGRGRDVMPGVNHGVDDVRGASDRR
jgi:hypothetical protein